MSRRADLENRRRADMHAIRLSPELVAQVQAERGPGHLFDKLDMRRTAHVVVDLQNGFMEPGAPVEVPVAREIVGAVNAALGSKIPAARRCARRA